MELNKTNIKDFLLGRLSNGVYVNRLITNNFYGYLTKPELTDADFQTLISFMTTNGVLVKDKNGNYSTTIDMEPGPTPPTPPVPTDRILYTVVEGGNKPGSTWITNNCLENVFDTSTGEGYLVLKDDVDSIKQINDSTSAFGSNNKLTSVTLPTQIKYIGNGAFRNCRELIICNLSKNVLSIDSDAFSSCFKLETVNIPNSVEGIGQYAFASCFGIKSIEIPNSVQSIGQYAFANDYIFNLIIPDSVTDIRTNAFNNLCNITYNGNATGSPWGALTINGYIENGLVFYDENKTILTGCDHFIERIEIPNTVETISKYAIRATIIKTIIIPDSVTLIEDWAFGSSMLETVEIGRNVAKICTYAFQGCYQLNNITCHSLTPPELENDIFPSNLSLETIYVPAESITDYQNSDWASYFTKFLPIQE